MKREAYLDRKMFTNIRNIILAIAYVILLLFIAVSVMDPRGFYQNLYLKCNFLGKSTKNVQQDATYTVGP